MSLRAPESILERPIDHRIDIWSFGCLFFEFLTGTPLFAVFHMAGTPQRETDDDHLLQMIDIIGHLPPELCSHWTRYDRYFDKSLGKIRTNVGEGDSVEEELITSPSLEDFFKESKPKEMNDAECADVIALLRSILQFNPDMRPTANEILQHPYMAAIETPQMTKSSGTV
jgi:serine/threonine protein kinase